MVRGDIGAGAGGVAVTPAALRYEALPIQRLTPAHLAAWATMTAANDELRSPFFHPDYALAVGAERDGIEVCVLLERDVPVGFFPFERLDGGIGRPVGGSMSNFQGMIAAPELRWNAEQLVRAAGLRTLKFHHQLCSQTELDRFASQRANSPYMDLGAGWSAYVEARRAAGVKRFNALPREIRRLEREVGPLRFTPHASEATAFETLISWKVAQYERTGVKGSLQQAWSLAVLRRLAASRDGAVRGMLSTLHSGDRLVAVHLGIHSATELHYWYPTYDPEVARHSPGLILLHEIGRWCAEHGIARINLGKGESQYKDWFGSATVLVGVGQVDVPVRASLLRRIGRRLLRRS